MAFILAKANGGPTPLGRKVNRSHAVELTWGTFLPSPPANFVDAREGRFGMGRRPLTVGPIGPSNVTVIHA